jgi:hypothetical protein
MIKKYQVLLDFDVDEKVKSDSAFPVEHIQWTANTKDLQSVKDGAVKVWEQESKISHHRLHLFDIRHHIDNCRNAKETD